MADEKPRVSKTQGTLLAILVALGGLYYFTAGQDDQKQAVQKQMVDIEHAAQRQMVDIKAKVASDAVAQYGIAKRQGDAMQICSQASMVCAAFLQAENESQYVAWKATEKADCAKAGVVF